MQTALGREDVPHHTLIARFAKAVLLLFFAAMSLVEMDVARENRRYRLCHYFYYTWLTYFGCSCCRWKELFA